MLRNLILSVTIFSLLHFPATAFSQTVPPNPGQKKRPTVGLVLSGGGARGFAHIGVLKVLEENHVPVDYIAGASMGGLIGSLYAMGKTPAEIEAIVEQLDWERLLAINTQFEDLSFRRRQDRLNIPAPVTLEAKEKGSLKGLKLPPGLNSGHEIGLLIDKLTLPYSTVQDFNNLPIPFQAVGTDMVNGDSVVLKSGSLSRSLRATMSIPGIFVPVEVDGRILSDGGLINNIPTNVVKAMGADIVLVVNIESQAGGREALESLPGILSQTISIATMESSRRSLREADIILAPDLGTYKTGDFTKSREIIKLGYDGAAPKASLLRSLSLDDAAWQQHLAARKARQLPDKAPVPELIAVQGEDANSTKMIEKKLGDKYAGQPLDNAKQEVLAKDLTELTGTGRFNSLDYQLGSNQGRPALIIGSNDIGGGAAKPTRLELGLDLYTGSSDTVSFNLLGRLTFFDIGKHGSEWRTDFQLGSNTLIASEYFRPLGGSKFFIAPRASFFRRNIDLYSNETQVAEYAERNASAGVDLGYTFNGKSEFRAGYTLGYQKASRHIGDPVLPDVSGMYSTAGLRWVYDSLNNAQVPTSGVLSRNTINYYFDSPGASGGFTQAETRSSGFLPVGMRSTVFAFGGGGTTFGATAPALRQFTLGGQYRIGGYGTGEFRGSNYLQGGFGFLHNPKSFPTIFGGKIYLGAWYEGGSVFEKFGNASYRQSVTGGSYLETPIGPIFVGASFTESGRGRFYFSFGHVIR